MLTLITTPAFAFPFYPIVIQHRKSQESCGDQALSRELECWGRKLFLRGQRWFSRLSLIFSWNGRGTLAQFCCVLALIQSCPHVSH